MTTPNDKNLFLHSLEFPLITDNSQTRVQIGKSFCKGVVFSIWIHVSDWEGCPEWQHWWTGSNGRAGDCSWGGKHMVYIIMQVQQVQRTPISWTPDSIFAQVDLGRGLCRSLQLMSLQMCWPSAPLLHHDQAEVVARFDTLDTLNLPSGYLT